MSKLFLELYCEEIKSELFDAVKTSFAAAFTAFFAEYNVALDEKMKIYLTPCRIAINIDDIPDELVLSSKKICAPKVNAEETEIQGFLKAFNLKSVDELSIDGDNYILVQNNVKLSSKDAIRDNIANILSQAASGVPRQMRWGNGYRWIAPLRNILCIFDGEVMDFEFCGLKSNNYTFGHKNIIGFYQKVEVSDFENYMDAMKLNFVVVDQNEREQILIKELVEIQNSSNTSLYGLNIDNYEENLIKKIVNTTEYPNALLAEFDSKFLQLPKIIITSLLYNEYNCFCLKNNSDNSLSNKFIIFADTKTDNGASNIISGFQNTVNESFSAMFLELAKYTSENLETKYAKLKSLPYYKNFGTMYDKIERLTELSRFICLFLPHCDLIATEEAVKLSKIDFTTTITKENPNLKGHLSAYYAKVNGYSQEICDGIKESYEPRKANDKIPTSDIAKALSLSDRIDWITTLFIANNEYNSSKDPYGIRKNITSIIRIMVEGNINIPLNILIHKSISLFKTGIYKLNNDKIVDIKQTIISIETKIINLFKRKFIGYSMDLGYSKTIILSVIEPVIKLKNKKPFNINIIFRKIVKISEYIKNNESKFNEIKNTYRRMENILADFKINNVKLLMGKLFKKPKNQEETAINKSIKDVKRAIKDSNKTENYDECFSKILQLTSALNVYLNSTTIKTDNKKETNERLFLLFRIKSVLNMFLDFDKM